jgi:hypothetical protein
VKIEDSEGAQRWRWGVKGELQGDLLMTWVEMSRSSGHVLYDRLQKLLSEVGFDAFVVGFQAPFRAIFKDLALGVRQDGQKMLLAVNNMGGESEAAWRALLDDLVKRGMKMPELVIVDGAPGLEKALAALWSDMPIQRCTVYKHRNLLARAPTGARRIEG